MVEGRQTIYKPEHRLVWNNKPKGAIHLFLMALICRLYGNMDCANFSEAWMPLEYTMTISKSRFNWGAIISKQLSTNILQAQTPKDGEASAFHMASYLLDVIYARNIFAGMNLR